MVFAKAKTRAVRMMRAIRAGQGSPDSLAFEVALEHVSHDESSDWPLGQTDGQCRGAYRDLYSRCVALWHFLGWKLV